MSGVKEVGRLGRPGSSTYRVNCLVYKNKNTMRSRGFYVLCYSEKDYKEKNGETKKIGPFKHLINAWKRRKMELLKNHWYFAEVVERVTVTDYE